MVQLVCLAVSAHWHWACCLQRLWGPFLRGCSPTRTSPLCIVANGSSFPGAGLVELHEVPASHSLHPVKDLLNASSPLKHNKNAGVCYFIKYRCLGMQYNEFTSYLCYVWCKYKRWKITNFIIRGKWKYHI